MRSCAVRVFLADTPIHCFGTDWLRYSSTCRLGLLRFYSSSNRHSMTRRVPFPATTATITSAAIQINHITLPSCCCGVCARRLVCGADRLDFSSWKPLCRPLGRNAAACNSCSGYVRICFAFRSRSRWTLGLVRQWFVLSFFVFLFLFYATSPVTRLEHNCSLVAAGCPTAKLESSNIRPS